MADPVEGDEALARVVFRVKGQCSDAGVEIVREYVAGEVAALQEKLRQAEAARECSDRLVQEHLAKIMHLENRVEEEVTRAERAEAALEGAKAETRRMEAHLQDAQGVIDSAHDKLSGAGIGGEEDPFAGRLFVLVDERDSLRAALEAERGKPIDSKILEQAQKMADVIKAAWEGDAKVKAKRIEDLEGRCGP